MMMKISTQVEEGSSLELRFKVVKKSELKLDFPIFSKVLHSGTEQPDMVDIRVNGKSLCSMVGGCGHGWI